MEAYMKRIGGDLTLADFQTHRSDWVTPACVPYRHVELCELPPNSQGYAALQMANILNNVELNQWPRGDARVLHYLTESKRLAYEDVAKYYADPDFADMPIMRERKDNAGLTCAMSNSFGFGGTNGTLVMKKV